MSRKRSKPESRTPTGMSTESVLRDIQQLVEGQEFESLDQLNAFLGKAFSSGRPGRLAARSSLHQAQELMYQAWEQRSRARRIALARKALGISPDCADAYVLLAEEAGTTEEACALYAAGCEAGERALGPKAFLEHAGHFWGLFETRPYMRARLGLAMCLLASGRDEEALTHYRELLRLNPNDNQGVRYTLASALLHLGRDAELLVFLDGPAYGDDASAAWSYTRALATYRLRPGSPAARKALVEALRVNRHVPAYLTGERRLPRRLPDYIGFGDESEAIAYASDHAGAWQSTPGALDSLREITETE